MVTTFDDLNALVVHSCPAFACHKIIPGIEDCANCKVGILMIRGGMNDTNDAGMSMQQRMLTRGYGCKDARTPHCPSGVPNVELGNDIGTAISSCLVIGCCPSNCMTCNVSGRSTSSVTKSKVSQADVSRRR